MGKALLFALAALSLWAQDWTPSKIVAMSEYPRIPGLAHVQGTVEVKCSLDSSGNVTAAEMISGNAMLGKAASENALQWKFHPVSKEARGNSVTLTYVFLFEGKPQEPTNSTFVFEMPNKIQIVAPSNAGIIRGAP